MLMVIFGAGASYDSFAAAPPSSHGLWRDYRPPLANQLFDQRFADDIQLFPKCHAVIPYLQSQGIIVERELERLQGEASAYQERHKQLAAIRYYLQHMLSRCLNGWASATKGVSNYKTLLDQIAHRRTPKDEVCLVTFNYDTLLEDALPTVGVKLASISDYIGTYYHVIKLHGSINWAHNVEKPTLTSIERLNPWQVVSELIDRAPELHYGQSYEIVSGYPIGRSGLIPLFPALAIPVENKPGYECPPDHLEALEKCLPQISKVLVVGWRAAENQFLKSLAENMHRDTRIMVVSSNEAGAAQVISRMKEAGVDSKFVAGTGGFSNLVLSREADGFFRN